MKSSLNIVFTALLVLSTTGLKAQHFTSADDYLNFIGKQHKEIAEKITKYTTDIVKGNAKKYEGERKEILNGLKTAHFRINSMHPYKVDKSFQDSAIAYLNSSSRSLNREVPKLILLEDSLGKSFTGSKKYLDQKEFIISQLSKAEESLNRYGKTFVAKYKIKEEYNDDEIQQKLQKVNEVNSYYRSIFLSYLKCSKQESYVLKAVTKKDTAEMLKENLLFAKYIREGNQSLDSLGSYKNDNSLSLAAKKVLQFYQVESEFKLPALVALLAREDAYLKFKKSMDAKSESEKNQEEKDQLVREVAEHNDFQSSYNAIINDLNMERPKALEGWNKASETFLGKNL